MKHWVVFEVMHEQRRYMRWCLVGDDPGFERVVHTPSDGLGVLPDDEVPMTAQRGDHLFTVAVFPEDDVLAAGRTPPIEVRKP